MSDPKIHVQITGDASSAVSEHAKFGAATGRSTSEVKKLLNVFLREFPLAGVLAKAAFSPVGAVLTGAIILFRSVKQHIAEVNAELDKLGEDAAKPLVRTLDLQRAALVDNAAALETLRWKLEQAARGERSLAEVQAEAIEVMRRYQQRAEELRGADEANELQRLELKHKLGLVAVQQYEREKLRIAQEYADKKRALDEEQMLAEIMLRRASLEDAETNQQSLAAAAEAAVNKQVDAERDLAELREFKASTRERTTQAEAQLKEFEARYAKEVKAFERVGWQATTEQAHGALWESGKFSVAQMPGIMERFARWSQLRGQIEAGKLVDQRAVEQEIEKRIAAERAGRASAAAEGKATAGEEFVTKSRRELKQQETELVLRREQNAKLKAIDEENRRLKEAALIGEPVPTQPGRGIPRRSLLDATGVPAVGRARLLQGGRRPWSAEEAVDQTSAAAQDRLRISDAAAGADAILAGNQATAQQASAIGALTQMLHLTGQNQQTILGFLARLNDDQKRFDEALRALKQSRGAGQ